MTIYSWVVTLAVPFFFLASGYFLAIKMDWPHENDNVHDTKRVQIHLKRMLRMYIVWTAIYFPMALYHFISLKTPALIAIFSYISGFFLLGEQYNSWQLWYLLSTVYALLVIYLMFKYKKATTTNMIILIVVASFLSVGSNALVFYGGDFPFVLRMVQKAIMYTIANGRIFGGLFYIPIGMFLAKKQFPVILNVFVLIACFIANFYLHNSIIRGYLLIITAIALFGVVVQIKLKDSWIYPKLRNMSTTIYLTHMYIWTFYYLIKYGKKTYGWDSFLVTVALAIFLNIGVSYFKKLNKAKL